MFYYRIFKTMTLDIADNFWWLVVVFILAFIIILIIYKSCCSKTKAKSAEQEHAAQASHINRTNQRRPLPSSCSTNQLRSVSTSSANQTLSFPLWPVNQTLTPPWPANQPWSVTLGSANQMPLPGPDDMPPSYDSLYDSMEIQDKY
jgi:hypothetical protein